MTNSEISKRAQSVLNKYSMKGLEQHDLHLVSDKFLGSNLYFKLDDECNFVEWCIVLEEEHLDAKKHSLLCGAIELVSKMGIAHLFKVSFRETESYLRDENHLPAWSDVTASRKWFNEALEEIISGVLNALIMKQGASLTEWDSLNLADKLLSVQHNLAKVSSVTQKVLGLKLELVSIEEEEVILTGGEDLMGHKYFDTLMERILEYLQFSLCSTKIKLVAQ